MSNVPRKSVLNDAIKRKIKSPCYGCSERHSNCHSDCEQYAEYKELIETEKAKACEHYRPERKLEFFNIEVKRKAMKNRGRGSVKKWSEYR